MPDLIYSTQTTDFDQNAQYKNPRYFNGSVTDAKSVLVIGDWPDVVAAYKKAGIPVDVQDAATNEENTNISKSAQSSNSEYDNVTKAQLCEKIKELGGEVPDPVPNKNTLIELYESLLVLTA